MQNYPKISGPKQSLLLAGTAVGVALTLVILTQLPLTQAAIVSSLGLGSLIVACAYISKPLYWWIGVGAIAGTASRIYPPVGGCDGAIFFEA